MDTNIHWKMTARRWDLLQAACEQGRFDVNHPALRTLDDARALCDLGHVTMIPGSYPRAYAPTVAGRAAADKHANRLRAQRATAPAVLLTPSEAGVLLLAPYDGAGHAFASRYQREIDGLVGEGLLEQNPTAPERYRATEKGAELLKTLVDRHTF